MTLFSLCRMNSAPNTFSPDNPLTIFGYSQSATAESIAMTATPCGRRSPRRTALRVHRRPVAGRHWHLGATHPRWRRVQFGNGPGLVVPDGRDGEGGAHPHGRRYRRERWFGQQVLGNVTPDYLYPTTIYTLEGDSVAQFQPVFESSGLLGTITHLFTTARGVPGLDAGGNRRRDHVDRQLDHQH